MLKLFFIHLCPSQNHNTMKLILNTVKKSPMFIKKLLKNIDLQNFKLEIDVIN